MADATWKDRYPSELRFTHDSIKTIFRDGRSMVDTLKSILDYHLLVSDIPPMEVMQYKGRYYVVRGNRRLYLYQKLEQHGYVRTVQVRKIPFDAILFEKMHTTENRGKSVRIRGFMGYMMGSVLDEIITKHKFGVPQPTPSVMESKSFSQRVIHQPDEDQYRLENTQYGSQRPGRRNFRYTWIAFIVGVVIVIGYFLLK